MTAVSAEEMAMDASWKNLVKVNGSFYCNLSLGQAGDAECCWPGAASSPDASAAAASMAHVQPDKPIYVNHFNGAAIQSPTPSNRTILRIGDDHEPPSLGYEVANGHQHHDHETPVESTDNCHTIKLVIGEPLSLDTSEYVSWDGSQAGGQSGASTDDNAPDEVGDDDDDDEDDDDEEDDIEDDAEGERSPPRYAPPPPPPPPVIDELTDSCCQFFNERQLRFFKSPSWSGTAKAGSTVPDAPLSGLQGKMEHLRREIVSLVNQDDALFRQLLALNTTIHQLRSQSMQRTENYTSSHLHGHLSPSPSTNSLTSLTSMSDTEDGPNDASETGELSYSGNARFEHETPSTAALSSAVSQALTRKRVSYPPRARNRSGSQLSRYSFNSSSSTSSAASSASSSAVGSPTWYNGSDTKPGAKPARTPRSPHSSFYSRASSKQHHSRLAITQKLQQRSLTSGSAATSDLLTVLHKRQGSYDSGCQVSEPSDAEVFV